MKAKQTPKKKAAKKAPAKKLIEGKYTHKYLVRLEESEGKYLTELMKFLNTKNYTTATITAIEKHIYLNVKIDGLQKEIRELNEKMRKQESLLYGLKTNLKGLFDLPLIDIALADDDDDDDDDEMSDAEFDVKMERYRQTSILDYDDDED